MENAFKHLSHYSNRSNDVAIKLEANDGVVNFTVVNTTESKAATLQVHQSGGIGLKNVKRRLELLYPGKHRLDITNNNGVFEVLLQVDMNN